MELFHLYPGVDHLLPDEECDVYTINELDPVYGVGLLSRDLTRVPPMPLRMCGTPIGRTSMLTGMGLFLAMIGNRRTVCQFDSVDRIRVVQTAPPT